MTTASSTALPPYPLTWYPGASDCASDQQADLHDGYWAETGPDGRHAARGLHWTWSILRDGGEEVTGGFTVDQGEAQAAVATWGATDLLAAELAAGILSEAFARFGRTAAACGTAARHITRTNAFRNDNDGETRSCQN